MFGYSCKSELIEFSCDGFPKIHHGVAMTTTVMVSIFRVMLQPWNEYDSSIIESNFDCN
jgi:hypothetical protein